MTIEYFGTIRDQIKAPQQDISLPKGTTVMEALEQVLAQHENDLKSELLAPKGEPLPNVILTLNGHRIIDGKGMNQPIHDPSSLHILVMPPFTGGG